MGVCEYLISVLGWKVLFDNLSNAMDHYQTLFDSDYEEEEGSSVSVVKCMLMEEVISIHNMHGGWPDIKDVLLKIDNFEFRCKIESGSNSYGDDYVYFGVHYTEYTETKSEIPLSDVLKFNELKTRDEWLDVVNFIKMIQGSYEEPAIHSLSYLS